MSSKSNAIYKNHCNFVKSVIFAVTIAGIAQLVEHDLAKVGVASSSLVSRSRKSGSIRLPFFYGRNGKRPEGGVYCLVTVPAKVPAAQSGNLRIMPPLKMKNGASDIGRQFLTVPEPLRRRYMVC